MRSASPNPILPNLETMPTYLVARGPLLRCEGDWIVGQVGEGLEEVRPALVAAEEVVDVCSTRP